MGTFKVGDRARITGNNTDGLRHYFDVGDEVTVLEDRTEQAEPSYLVGGPLFTQDVHPADLELVDPASAEKAALDTLTTSKTRRAVLAKVLHRLDEDYAGVELGDDTDARSGVFALVTQLGLVAQAVADDDCGQAHFELVRLAADCLSWLEDAEEQGGDDSL